jgi:uncharacterized HAD superfamily protein
MPKPVLAVDFDDVVAGFNLAFSQWHNTHHGTAVAYADICSYDMAHMYGVDQHTIEHRVFDFCHHHHDLVEPLHDAVEHLQLLKRRYRLAVVTSRCESIAEVTLGWKKRHVPQMFSEAHFTNGFATKFPGRKRTKLEVCEAIGAVALIDDAVSHANEVSAGLGISVFLPDRPWNQEGVWDSVTRVYNWEEITKQLLL